MRIFSGVERKFLPAWLCLALCWFSCAPSRVVRPLNKGEKTVSFNLGGPLIHFSGAAIPMPLTSVMYARGISQKTTAFASLHLTSLAFGVFQTDVGICRQLYYNPEQKFGISANPVLNFAVDRWEGNKRLWPELDINLYKEFGKRHLLYGGVSNWLELNGNRPHGEKQADRLFINPHLGYGYSKRKWNYNLEVKWLAPGKANQPNVAEYIGINHQGALGVYFNFTRKLFK